MRKSFWWGLGFILVIVLIWYVSSKPGKYDDFAQCLNDEGAVMYGAYWCPHCQAQKKLFGSSWDKVNYVECSLPNGNGQTEICKKEGIVSYPVWKFADGKEISGQLSLEQLGSFTGCDLLVED